MPDARAAEKGKATPTPALRKPHNMMAATSLRSKNAANSTYAPNNHPSATSTANGISGDASVPKKVRPMR